jgi:hypothetical protein
MRIIPDRAILTVLRHSGLWAVEHDGEPMDAKGAAHLFSAHSRESGNLGFLFK